MSLVAFFDEFELVDTDGNDEVSPAEIEAAQESGQLERGESNSTPNREHPMNRISTIITIAALFGASCGSDSTSEARDVATTAAAEATDDTIDAEASDEAPPTIGRFHVDPTLVFFSDLLRESKAEPRPAPPRPSRAREVSPR